MAGDPLAKRQGPRHAGAADCASSPLEGATSGAIRYGSRMEIGTIRSGACASDGHGSAFRPDTITS